MQELSVLARSEIDPLDALGGGRWRADPTMLRIEIEQRDHVVDHRFLARDVLTRSTPDGRLTYWMLSEFP